VRRTPTLRSTILCSALAVTGMQLASAQSATMTVPKSVQAGEAFTVASVGSGNATLYIVGPAQVLKRDIKLGEPADFPAGSLYNAGRYVALLEVGTASAQADTFEVVPAKEVANVSFLARPSRLPVGIHSAITGAVYIFDKYFNLIAAPQPVSFELAHPGGAVEKRVVETQNGAAWTGMDSTGQQGADKFTARVANVSSSRIVEQVPGDPCGLKMSAKQSGQQLALSTDPVRDCNGNAVPDGTIVTFTETYHGAQSTVDVPLKRGIAQVDMPIHSGATISVASGVVMGNQIGWGK
jgi:hypothetical protein